MLPQLLSREDGGERCLLCPRLLCAESEEAVNTGPAHIKIHFPWNVGLEHFSSYSMLQGRARIQTLIKITQLFFFFLSFFAVQPQVIAG